MENRELRPLPPWLKIVRLVTLVALAASIPLAGFLGVEIPGTSFQKKAATLAAFDVLIWAALVVVVLSRFLREGGKGLVGLVRAVPAAGWFLVALTFFAGVIWPRLAGLQPAGVTAVGKKLLPLVEYGLLSFVVLSELVAEERARGRALAALAAASAAAMLYGLAQYFGSGHGFYVGSFFGGSELLSGGNRNAFGAFLAVAVPFFAVMAVSAPDWRGRAGYGVLAGLGVLLCTSGGGVLGIICGVLLGAMLAGRVRGLVATGALVALLLIGQVLPRHNLTTALDSVRVERRCPKTGERLLALRYLRAGAEVNVLRAPFRENQPERKLFFGVGPGAYTDRTKRFRPGLDERPPGETDKVANFDVLANEPGSFNLFGVAAAELGLLGLVGFLWFFASLARRCLLAWRATEEGGQLGAVALGALAAVVGAAVASPFNSVWIRGSGPLLVFLVAVGSCVVVSDAPASDTPGQAE